MTETADREAIIAELAGAAPTVLIAAAGRRTSLVRAFVDATHARRGRTLAGDVDGLAPALYLADEAIRLLPSDHAQFLDDLVDQVRRRGITVVVPTIDPDLPILAAGRASVEAAGARVAVSSASFIATTRDKVRTGTAFGDAGIRTPRTWDPASGLADLPPEVIVKPRAGSASKDVHRVRRADVDRAIQGISDAMVQELLSGPEITIDAFLDLGGQPIHYVPRLRIKTIGGESVEGRTMDHDPELESWIEGVLRVCSTLGGLGPLTIQSFLTEGGPVLTEVNARFGGGFPLALAAGGDYPAWLLDLFAGSSVAPRLGDYEPGLFMTRSHVEHFVRQPLW